MKQKILFTLLGSLLVSNVFAETSVLNYNYGFYSGQDLSLEKGSCKDCLDKSAQFYFKNELVVVPKQKTGNLSFIWNNATIVSEGILSKDGKKFKENSGKEFNFEIVPKIKSNLSYYNDKSIDYFSKNEVLIKGDVVSDKLIAKTVWPKNTRLDENVKLKPLDGKSIYDLVRDKNISDKDVSSRLLWSNGGKEVDFKNKNVLAFILNGAQGDDDEAHGGHFAVATGKTDNAGQWNNLLVNNFYGLNSISEKGIIASRIPLDIYQGDLNSGQSWYRPTYVLMAILKDKAIPEKYQENINKKFDEFYKHHFEYNHALSNCAGINLETFRGLGWNLKKEGVESYLKGIAAIPYVGVTDSFDSAKKASNYMMSEKTDLYPFVAFNTLGDNLLNNIVVKKDLSTDFEKELAENIEAVVYVKLPQYPSSRAEGLAPIANFDEYMSRVPKEKSDWKIVPVPANPFPADLKDNKVEKFTLQPYIYAIIANLFILLGIVSLIRKLKKGRKNV